MCVLCCLVNKLQNGIHIHIELIVLFCISYEYVCKEMRLLFYSNSMPI